MDKLRMDILILAGAIVIASISLAVAISDASRNGRYALHQLAGQVPLMMDTRTGDIYSSNPQAKDFAQYTDKKGYETITCK